MVTLEIVRGVFIGGQAYKAGDRVELPDYDANYIIGLGKAKKAEPLPAAEGVAGEASVEEPVIATKRMGRKVKPKGV